MNIDKTEENFSNHERTRERERRWLILLIALGLLLRCTNLFHRLQLQGDETSYHTVAVNLLHGDGFREGEWYAYRYPGYCAFLAASYKIGGYQDHLIYAPRFTILLQIIIAELTCLLFYRRVRKTFGPAAALIALSFASLYIPFVRLPGRLFTENLSLPLFFGFWLFYLDHRQKPDWRKAAGCGICLGLCALCRESALTYALPILLYDLINSKRYELIKRAKMVSLIAIFALLTVTPWMIRNYTLFSAFVLITTNGPTNVYYGAQKESTGFARGAGPYGSKEAERVKFKPDGYPYPKSEPQKGIFQELYLSQAQKTEAINFIKNNPLLWMKLGLVKLYYFWTLPSRSFFNVHGFVEKVATWIWDVSYLIIVIPGLIGAWKFRRRYDEMILAYGLLIVPCILAFLTVVVSRYRFPTDYALMFFAAGYIDFRIKQRGSVKSKLTT